MTANRGQEAMRAYVRPAGWAIHDRAAVQRLLTEALGAARTLAALPLSRDWSEEIAAAQRAAALAGLLRLDGAAVSDAEAADAVRTGRPVGGRSLRVLDGLWTWLEGEAAAAPLGPEAVRRIQRATEPPYAFADALRPFAGAPGDDARDGFRGAFDALLAALERPPAEDPLVLALAAHYHLAVIHPYRARNGMAGLAAEAHGLARLGLRGPRAPAMPAWYARRADAYRAAIDASEAAGTTSRRS